RGAVAFAFRQQHDGAADPGQPAHRVQRPAVGKGGRLDAGDGGMVVGPRRADPYLGARGRHRAPGAVTSGARRYSGDNGPAPSAASRRSATAATARASGPDSPTTVT